MKISKLSSLCLILISFVVSIYRITQKPDNIILHWGIDGIPTGEGSKYLIIVLPFIALFVYFIINYCDKHPFKLNLQGNILQNDNNKNTIRKYNGILLPLVMLVILYLSVCSAGYLQFCQYMIYIILAIIAITYIYYYSKLER